MSDVYEIIEARSPKLPIIVSVPHSGLAFPEVLRNHFQPTLVERPDDTDFFVDQLYEFVSDMGITMIRAKYSRWVIDLNRSPNNQSLYQDGRIITALTPATNFMGEAIYRSPERQPDQVEINRRKELYFYPYYQQIATLLEDRKKQFGKVLLWDAHSIRQFVPTIQANPFPDLILGDNKGLTAAPELVQTALQQLAKDGDTLSYNTPFQGGNITRHFGKPAKGIHAIQLEMCKILYMDDQESTYHKDRANRIQILLRNNFEALNSVLLKM